MKLLTEVSLSEYPFSLNHHSQVLMMGSCFTENIGRLIERYLFPVCINPFGVIYNPLSVKRGLEALMRKKTYVTEDLDHYNGLWFSFDHYTGFSDADQAKTLEKINHAFLEAKAVLEKADILILTWGTSWVYRYKHTGEVVCNCHKIPAKEFIRTRLTIREIIAAYESLLPELFDFNKHLKILHTVSPVRHWKDGAHGNQLSKAALLLAGDALQQKFPEQFFYFPSYEIVMDELRDYRFYAEDMLHTSDQATRYIWEKFQGALMEAKSREIIIEVESLRKMLEHRPLNKEGEAAQVRQILMQEKLEVAKKKHPDLDWEKLY
ncbi:MAG: GSCFA domain protein [Bacteroidia bacterium]|nr:MAG: GSCFA domain protein [Bacteroidia bacterium]